jgi:hypothetical protein
MSMQNHAPTAQHHLSALPSAGFVHPAGGPLPGMRNNGVNRSGLQAHAMQAPRTGQQQMPHARPQTFGGTHPPGMIHQAASRPGAAFHSAPQPHPNRSGEGAPHERHER